MVRNLIFIAVVFFNTLAFTQVVEDIPGLIPLEPGQRPAVDLTYKGEILLPEEAFALFQNGMDLSTLNPGEQSDLWRNEIGETPNPNWDELPVNDNEEVEFTSNIMSPTGFFRFSAQKNIPGQGLQNFSFMLSKNIHNVLLRKALLRKLGYIVPETKYLKRLVVNFSTPAGKEIFLRRLAEGTFGDPNRWVVNTEEKISRQIILQDLIVTEGHPKIYNLASGYMPRGHIKRRRLLNALNIPYELVNVPESVNLLSWTAGRIVSDHLKISYRTSSEFDGNYDDSRWIMRRISKLTRQDFSEIVQAANLPPSVALLLKEKIISRRNSLVNLLNIDANEISVNPKIELKPNLIAGKLVKELWQGYGARFSYGDPESPLSGSEIWALVKSKFLGNVIGNLVWHLNDGLIPHTDLQEKIIEENIEIAKKQLTNFFQTGELKKVNFGAYVIPMFDIDLIGSRDVVIGSYLGTDNTVQLADAVGLSLKGGIHVGTYGLPSGWSLNGGAAATYTRIYTHLRPIKSIKKAVKYPFKNILVPILKRKYGKFFDGLMSGKLDEFSEEEKQEKVTEVMNIFKENLEIGESLIISDHIGGEIHAAGGFGFNEWVRAFAEFRAGLNVISRLHINRKDENTIHIYKDLGNIKSLMLTIGLEAGIPVLTVSAKVNYGQAKTRYYSLDINDNLQENEDIILVANALRSLFLKNSLELVEVLNKPYTLTHRFKEKQTNATFLFWRWGKINTRDVISVTHPEKEIPKKYFRRVVAKRTGRNWESLALDSLNYLIDELFEDEINISNPNNGRPGDTIYGSAKIRKVTIDGELKDALGDEDHNHLKNMYISLAYTWRGWKMSKKKALKLVEDINEKHNRPFHSPQALAHTDNILFYNINMEYHFYNPGIKHFLQLSSSQIKNIFEKYAIKSLYKTKSRVRTGPNMRGNPNYRVHVLTDYMKWLRDYQRHYQDGNYKKYTDTIVKMISMAEEYLSTEGIITLFGGKENVFVSSYIQGFKEGDENGDQNFFSHSIGRFGSNQINGPLNYMKNKLGMSESEFFVYWILGRF